MIAVGRIRKSVGLRGEIKIEPLGGNPDRFQNLPAVWIGNGEAEALRHRIQSARAHGGDAVVKIEGIDSRSDSDPLRGLFVFVEDNDAAPPVPGSYFVHEIVGLNVLAEDGSEIGPVTDVLTLPAGDVWCVRYRGKEVLIPAVKEVIRSVDVGSKTIVVRVIEGLLD